MPDLYISKTKDKLQEGVAASVEKKQSEQELPQDTAIDSKSESTKKNGGSYIGAFTYMPQNARFETQEKEEKIVLFLRRHPITNFPWILLSLALGVGPVLLNWFPFVSFLPQNFQVAAVTLWYLLVTAITLEGALSWFFNVYIITDERIIDVDFHNLIYREISDTKTDKIQDVTYKMGGVLGTIFNYGTLVVQTAGTNPNFEFEAVPNPSLVAKILQVQRTEEEIEAVEGRIR